MLTRFGAGRQLEVGQAKVHRVSRAKVVRANKARSNKPRPKKVKVEGVKVAKERKVRMAWQAGRAQPWSMIFVSCGILCLGRSVSYFRWRSL
jgi:hypothetical protein